jgi:hypothetical protein
MISFVTQWRILQGSSQLSPRRTSVLTVRRISSRVSGVTYLNKRGEGSGPVSGRSSMRAACAIDVPHFTLERRNTDEIEASMPFLDALTLAGWPTEDAAEHMIVLVRQRKQQQMELPLKDTSSSAA